MVEFEGVSTTPRMTPWSSVGASSRGACVNIGQRQQAQHDPGGVDGAARVQRAVEQPRVQVLDAIEPAADARRQPLLLPAQEVRRHHGRERQGDDAGDGDGAGQRQRELPEERAGQAALEARWARRPPPA